MTGQPAIPAPDLAALRSVVAEAAGFLATAAEARAGGYVNREGGDVAATGNARSLVHHVANYLAAGDVAARVHGDGPIVDVGSGVGALAAWMAARVGRALELVDADPDVRAVAERAFPDVAVHADLADLPAGWAAVVTAMEVVEHVPRAAQLDFVRKMAAIVRPGGMLVCSTPDETAYVGRHSGYAPHVGSVDAAGLEHLLTAATGRPAAVWRLEGPAFAIGRVRRLVEPLGNRAWAGLQQRAPAAAERAAASVGRLAGTLSRRRPARAVGGAAVLPFIPPELLQVRAREWGSGTAAVGSGLLGVVLL